MRAESLYNFPGKVVDICENVVIGRYTDSWDSCKRFVHEFTIQDGTVLQDKDGNNYLKVRALRGDEYLNKTNVNFDSYTKTAANLPKIMYLRTFRSNWKSASNNFSIKR